MDCAHSRSCRNPYTPSAARSASAIQQTDLTLVEYLDEFRHDVETIFLRIELPGFELRI